jgi:nitronate monooxygenase
VTRFTERFGIQVPIVQAGMGGGIARHELAAAVSEAGGLGTIGTSEPGVLEGEIASARRLTDRPIAVNLLLPFARGEHFEVASQADLVVTFWGRPKRRTPGPWLHQCGSVGESLAARAAGADGVIAQGVEAGGHVRGTTAALELLAQIRAAVGPDYPTLLAGGIADAGDVERALDAGADAAVLGTRFVLCEESGAHPDYRRRLVEASGTILTELFGAGWPRAPHRVVANAATERWLRGDPRGPALIRVLNTVTGPLASRLPPAAQARMLRAQRPSSPALAAAPPSDQGPDGLVDSGPLYAGETVSRLDDILPAAQVVRDLAP